MLCLVNDLKAKNFVDLLENRAQGSLDQTAYLFLTDGETQTTRLTYQELDQNARAIAAHLQSIHAQGSRALLLYPSGLDFISAFFGCLYAGVVAVPAYPPRLNQNGDRLRAITTDAQVTLALTTLSLKDRFQHQLSSAQDLSTLEWVTTDHISPESAQNWTPPSLEKNALALLQYTSGATGTPKGVMITHENLLHNAAVIQHCFQDASDSMGVSWLPMYHDMGLIGGILQPLYLGRPMVLMSPTAFIQKPVRWLQAISEYGATTSGGPNFAYDLCVQKITAEQKSTLDLSRWRVAFSGAESVRAQTLDDFAEAFRDCGFRQEAFYPCYGMAEATLMVSSKLSATAPTVCAIDGVALEQSRVLLAEPDTASVRKIVGCGQIELEQAGLEQSIAIVNPNTLNRCAPNEVGEIWVSGPSLALGYWQRLDETNHAFRASLADGNGSLFLRTGDLGFIYQDELFVTGRLKDLIIIRGRNHYPQDIEWTVQASHPSLRVGHSAAFSIAVDGFERLVIVAEVERQALRHLNVDDVTSAVRQTISENHQLQVYAIALLKPGSLPKTSSGKIQRGACRTAFQSQTLAIVGEWREASVDVNQIQQAAEALLNKLNASEHSASEGLAETPSTGVKDGSGDRSNEDIQRWIVANLALYLKVRPEEISISEPFSHYGLDSSAALTLAAELSEWLGQELDPTIFWEYPSIESLAHHLELKNSKFELPH
jgi:acyl-CoA synthetase (AMP-forming)/AMP-acid ligase II/acyl carrier protein